MSTLLPDSDELLQALLHAHLDVKTIVYEETDCNRNKLNQINKLVYVCAELKISKASYISC